MVSIAGGEPLMHPQIDEIVRQLLDRSKIVFLCTNAVLLPKHLHKFTPHRNFAWMVHIDGLRERHDASVRKDGVFDQAVAAIKQAKAAGFRVMTNTTFFDTDTPQDVIDVLDYLNDELGVDNMQISPGYAYEKAPDQEHWLGVEQTRELFRKAFADGRRKKWRLNHSPLFLDFLEGKRRLRVHRVGHPVVLAARLAAALLPARRRLRQHVQGADRDHRLGRLRPGQGPALRQLHGPLRLRADRGARHHGLAAGVDPGGDRRCDGERRWRCPAGQAGRHPLPGRPAGRPGRRAAASSPREIRGVAGRHRRAAPAGTSGPTSAWSS